ncbi:MAG: alpha-L-arabinofuranosidase C-terminal domain-containing protein [Clostridia bacterium]|nr:alpha-L-arabinofuranosidase C-terminal domain-containing protein [Clostridia bacterium]
MKRVLSTLIVLMLLSSYLPAVYAADGEYVDTAQAIASYAFDGNFTDFLGGDDAVAYGNSAQIIYDLTLSSQVLSLGGTVGTYLEFPLPKNGDAALENMTISFDVKNATSGFFFTLYLGDGSSQSSGKNYYGIRIADEILISTVNSSTEKKITETVPGIQNTWVHVDFVLSNGNGAVYIDGEKKTELAGAYTLAECAATVARLGFSAWSADNAANALYDNLTIYDGALSDRGIADINAAISPIEVITINYVNENGTAIELPHSVRARVPSFNHVPYILEHINFEDMRYEYIDAQLIEVDENNNVYLRYANTGIPSDNLLLDIDFDSDSLSGGIGEANVVGSVDMSSGAAVFDGTAGNYLSITKQNGASLLASRDEFTISCMVKTENTATSWIHYTTQSDDTAGSNLNYIGIFAQRNFVKAERYNGNRSNFTETSSYDLSEWTHVAAVYTNEGHTLYVNGTPAAATGYAGFDISDMLGDSPVTYIGKANWGTNGEWATAAVDNYKIYDKAMPLTQIYYDGAMGNDEDKAEYIKNALYVPSQTKTDLNLPTTEEQYVLYWKSSNEAVITNEGIVTRPQSGSVNVTLSAVVIVGSAERTTSFDVTVLGEDYFDFTIDVLDQKGVDIQDDMFGLFFEDINYAADGGIYAEMIENRSFENLTETNAGATYYNGLHAWSAVDNTLTLATNDQTPLNVNNPHYLTVNVDGSGAFMNTAYEGVYIESGNTYTVSFFAKSENFSGEIISQVKRDGIINASCVVTSSVTQEWQKYTATLTAETDARYASFEILLQGSGSVDFDMISMMPDNAVCGVFRPDLVQLLREVNPGFIRFPGGCVVEGYNLNNAYRWKDTVGKVEERKANWNRWAADTAFPNYNQSYGLGFFEYFLLCEYTGARPLPVLNGGLACEYQSKEYLATDSAEFMEYVQDALDLIEFANSTDFENSVWAALRRDMGHPEPFNLELLGIGNEQWELSGNDWYGKYEVFEAKIHEKYPEIKLIGTVGPSVQNDAYYSAWERAREKAAENPNYAYAMDEHYYRSAEWFYTNDNFYDDYDRSVKVFAGEYAATTSGVSAALLRNNLDGALAEAAFLTGVERNADVVYMASYAPLFSRINFSQWTPDMIWFNDTSAYGTPSYYAQSMYSRNMGTYTLIDSATECDGIYKSASYDDVTGDIIIKLVNSASEKRDCRINIADTFEITGDAVFEVLTGPDKYMANSISTPDAISTQAYNQNVAQSFSYAASPYSFTVIRVKTRAEEVAAASIEINRVTTSPVALYYTYTPKNAENDDVILALFDEDDILVEVRYAPAASGAFHIENPEGYSIEAFIWDKESLTPQCESQKRTAE